MSTKAIRLTLKEAGSAIRLFFDPATRILRWVTKRVHAGGSMASAVRAVDAEREIARLRKELAGLEMQNRDLIRSHGHAKQEILSAEQLTEENARLREELASLEMQNWDLIRSHDRATQEILAMDTIVREDVEVLTRVKQALVDAQSGSKLGAPTLHELMKAMNTLPRTGVIQCAQSTLSSHFADLGGTNFIIVLWQACEHEGELVLECLHSCCPDYPLTPILNSMKRVLPVSSRLSTPETLLWHQPEIDFTVPDVHAAIDQSSSLGLYENWPGSALAVSAIKSVYCIKIADPVPPSHQRKTAGVLSVYADETGFFGNDRNMAIIRPSIKLFARVLERECIRLWINARTQKILHRLGPHGESKDEVGYQHDVEI